MVRFLLVFILLFTLSISNAQVSSVKVSPTAGNQGQNGIFYSLPRTVFQVDVVVTKADEYPGPYADYAQQLLGLTNFINRNVTNYAIKGIYIHQFSEADPNAVYFLNLGDRSGKSDRSFLLQLQANGVLKGMNESAVLNEVEPKSKIEMREDYFSLDFNYFADLNQVVRVDTIIRRIALDTANIEEVLLKQTLVEKSMPDRAKDAADTYMNIHKNRVELISGFQEVNYPAQTIAFMNNELRKMEADYLALFKGKRFLSEEKFSFYIIPEGDKSRQSYPVFKFSKERGVLNLDASAGERVSLIIQTNGVTDILKNQIPGEQASGIFYRVPESARVWVDDNHREYAKNTFLIPQLGALQSVNTSKTIFSVDPKTGMIKSIEIK